MGISRIGSPESGLLGLETEGLWITTLKVPGCSRLDRLWSSTVENECDRPCLGAGRNGLIVFSGQFGSSWFGFFCRCDLLLLNIFCGDACTPENRLSCSTELEGRLLRTLVSSPALSGGVSSGKTNGAWVGGDCKRWLPGRTTGLYINQTWSAKFYPTCPIIVCRATLLVRWYYNASQRPG
jgi:hypothetical protein